MGAVSIALFFFVQPSIRNVVKVCGCLGSKQTLSSILSEFCWCCLHYNKDHEVNSWHRSGRIFPASSKFFTSLAKGLISLMRWVEGFLNYQFIMSFSWRAGARCCVQGSERNCDRFWHLCWSYWLLQQFMPDGGNHGRVPADSLGNLQIIGFQANTCLIRLDRSKQDTVTRPGNTTPSAPWCI